MKNIPDFVFQFFYNIFSEEIRLFFEVGLRKFEPEISFSGNDAKEILIEAQISSFEHLR